MMTSDRSSRTASGEDAFVGVDVGGTKIAAVLMQDGSFRDSVRIPTGRGNQAVVDGILAVIRTLTERASSRPVAVGIGIPGRVDHRHGTVRDAVNLGVRRLDLSAELERRLELPVHVENDVNAAALGEASLVRPDLPTVAVLNAGTGLAAGIIRDGRIDHGSHGTVGEIGHVPVDPHQFQCACGQKGCLETVASGSAVFRLWPEGGGSPMSSLLREAESGNPRAREVLDVVLDGLTTAVLLLAMTVDPDVIVIAGGMANAGAPLLSAVRGRLRSRSASSAFLDSLRLDERVVLSDGETPVGAVGAALAAFAALRDQPRDQLRGPFHGPTRNADTPDGDAPGPTHGVGSLQRKDGNAVEVPVRGSVRMEVGCD